MRAVWKNGVVAVLLAMAGSLLAPPSQALADDASCDGVLSGGDGKAASARITAPAGRVYFVLSRAEKTPSCPSAGLECRAKAFLVPGDEVVVSSASNGFQCATYRSPAGVETDGYLPQAALTLTPQAAVNPADWVGSWRRDKEASIKFSLTDGGRALSIDGDATFGALDPDRVKRGAVNIGDLSGKAVPRGNVLALGEGYDGSAAPQGGDDLQCRARLRLFGRYLVVEDNFACGGANVSFIGVYIRAK